ncbi:MAG: MoxR family ATPase [Verrucomicrobiota bacterium]
MTENDLCSEQELKDASVKLERVKDALNTVIFGQGELIEEVMVGMLSGGHILLEGLPGLGKTSLVKGLSAALGLSASRIQFTPDLLPGDITGNPMLQEVDGERSFVFQQGPLFANLVLADEINRASPKTQSALLEGMQESSVTVMGESHVLPRPFFVLATQNPIELEGTYTLPEAQLDRFLFKILLQRNSVEVLEEIVRKREIGVDAEVEQVLSLKEFTGLTELARKIYLPDVVSAYIARLVHQTHPEEGEDLAKIKYGASPRAALALAGASKARALWQGRPNTSFEDVQAVAYPVLRHRLILDYTARMEGVTTDDVVKALLEKVPVQPQEQPNSLSAAKIH